MTQYVQNWDGGTGAADTVAVSSSNTDGPGNTPIQGVSLVGGATATFSATVASSGTLSLALSAPANGHTYAYAPMTQSVGTRGVCRFYMWHPPYQSGAAFALASLYIGSTTQVTGIYVTTAGNIGYGYKGLQDSGIPLPTNTWVRMEMGILLDANAANSQVDFVAYYGHSATPFYSSGPVIDSNMGSTPATLLRMGSGTSLTVPHAYYIDDVLWNDTLPSGYIGPSGTGGEVKVWNATAFVPKPMKVWNGTSWVIKPVKRWDGTRWLETSY